MTLILILAMCVNQRFDGRFGRRNKEVFLISKAHEARTTGRRI